MYKILVIGDPHLKVSNISVLRLLCEKICHLIKEQKPDGVVILGDLHDTHANINVYAWIEAREFIKKITNAVMANKGWLKYIIGNHDIPSNNQYLEGIHPFLDMQPADIVSHPCSLDTDIGRLGFIPYVPNGRFKEALDSVWTHTFLGDKYRTIFCHQEFKNADLGTSFFSKRGDEWPIDGDMIVSGHIHKRQKLQDNIIYIGSPYQTNFSETEDKFVSIFTYTKDSISEELFDLGMPKKLTFYMNVHDTQGFMIDLNNDNRVIIEDSSIAIAAFKKSDKYQELQKNAKVIFRPTDKVFVKKDVVKKPFLDLLKEYIEKEDKIVSEVFAEVLNDNHT